MSAHYYIPLPFTLSAVLCHSPLLWASWNPANSLSLYIQGFRNDCVLIQIEQYFSNLICIWITWRLYYNIDSDSVGLSLFSVALTELLRWMIYEEKEFISYSSEGWEIQGCGNTSGEGCLAAGDSLQTPRWLRASHRKGAELLAQDLLSFIKPTHAPLLRPYLILITSQMFCFLNTMVAFPILLILLQWGIRFNMTFGGRDKHANCSSGCGVGPEILLFQQPPDTGNPAGPRTRLLETPHGANPTLILIYFWITFVHPRHPQLGSFLPPKGHLIMSGDIFDCHIGERPGIFLNTLQCTSQSPTPKKELSSPECQ